MSEPNQAVEPVMPEPTKPEPIKPAPVTHETDALRLRVIFDTTPGYLAYLDTDLRYQFANRTYEQQFGLPNDKIVGSHISNVLGPSFENVRPQLEQALQGVRQHFEAELLTVHGVRCLRIDHIPDYGTDGEIRGVVIHGVDITERKRSEAALMQSEKLAAVGRLATSIAHEINNPLESVVNLLYLIEHTALQDPEQTARYSHVAQQELARVSEITTQTLRFFKQPTAARLTRLAELINSLLSLYRGRLANSNISVAQQIENKLEGVLFEGELRQVVNNLIANAIDAMPNGGRLLLRARSKEITGASGDKNRVLRLLVVDTGSGMDRATQARIFEPFFTTKGITGTGLGLWVSQQIVAKHGGSLTVRSRQGGAGSGTIFSLTIPLGDHLD